MSQHIKPFGSGKGPFHSYMSLLVHFKNPMRYLFVFQPHKEGMVYARSACAATKIVFLESER